MDIVKQWDFELNGHAVYVGLFHTSQYVVLIKLSLDENERP